MFKITKQWLEANKTEKGGYTQYQLRILGIKWPPKYGWKKSIIGMELTKEIVTAYCAGGLKFTSQ